MAAPGQHPPADLSRIGSEAILWIVRRAVEGGNEVEVLADWTKALVAHMRDGLSPELKVEVTARWPSLDHHSSPGTPHNEAEEGYTDGAFAVSFPRRAGRLPR